MVFSLDQSADKLHKDLIQRRDCFARRLSSFLARQKVRLSLLLCLLNGPHRIVSQPPFFLLLSVFCSDEPARDFRLHKAFVSVCPWICIKYICLRKKKSKMHQEKSIRMYALTAFIVSLNQVNFTESALTGLYG